MIFNPNLIFKIIILYSAMGLAFANVLPGRWRPGLKKNSIGLCLFPKVNVLACVPAKCASQNWRHFMNVVDGQNHTLGKPNPCKNHMKPEYGTRKDVLKFMVARNPWSRLISAYQSKISSPAMQRVRSWRRYSTNVMTEFPDSTTSIWYIDQRGRNRTLDIPSFEAFTSFVLEMSDQEMYSHWAPVDWAPISIICHTDNVVWDRIVHLENGPVEFTELAEEILDRRKNALLHRAEEISKDMSLTASPNVISGDTPTVQGNPLNSFTFTPSEPAANLRIEIQQLKEQSLEQQKIERAFKILTRKYSASRYHHGDRRTVGDYYSDLLARQVAARYQNDVNLFNYSWEEVKTIVF